MEREIDKDKLQTHLQKRPNNSWNNSDQQGISLVKTILSERY